MENILKYIHDKELEQIIITSADPHTISKLATDYTNFKFNKKIGKKKLALYKKQSKDILNSETVKHYSQYIICSKHINHNIQTQSNNEYSMLQKNFKKIPKIPAPSEFNITDIYFITTIQSLDYFIRNTMLYNNKKQIIDE